MSLVVSIQRKYVASSNKVSAISGVISSNPAGAGSTSSGVYAGIHREMGRLSAEILDNNVVVTFAVPFQSKPIGVSNLKVYRMVENIPIAGKWVMQDVLHYFDDDEDWLITTGFSLFIHDSEPLTGVIIEYCFTE